MRFAQEIKKTLLAKGFTLIELLVVIAIFVIITGVVMMNIPDFRNKSSVEMVAHEVATFVRQAQTYSLSQKINVDDSYASFGVYFTKTANANGQIPVIIYAKNSGNNHYDSSAIKQEEYLLPRGFKMEIGTYPTGATTYNNASCFFPESGSRQELALDLKPKMFVDGGTSLNGNISLKISNADGSRSRLVIIFTNGQIAVSSE